MNGFEGDCLIEMFDVCLQRGGRNIIEDVHLALFSGEVAGIIGRSGSGKSSLLRCMAGLERPSEGEIKLCETATLGFVTQHVDLIAYRTVLDNLTLALRCRKGVTREDGRARARAWAERFGIAHILEKYPTEISGGEAQRASIARIMVLDPRLVIFDEVTSNLDPILAGEIGELCVRLASEGRCVVFASHQLRLVEEHASRIFFVDGGRVSLLDGGQPLLQRSVPVGLKRFMDEVKRGW